MSDRLSIDNFEMWFNTTFKDDDIKLFPYQKHLIESLINIDRKIVMCSQRCGRVSAINLISRYYEEMFPQFTLIDEKESRRFADGLPEGIVSTHACDYNTIRIIYDDGKEYLYKFDKDLWEQS